MFGLVPVLLLLVVLGLVVAGVVLASGSRPSVTGASPPPALPAPDPVLARVKDLAWDHRDLDTPLADALIGYLNEHERDADQLAVRNQVGEIAWQHRDTCPNLSVLVIDLLRHPGA
jgi:hypothetical protein